jgi:hypothetical protein
VRRLLILTMLLSTVAASFVRAQTFSTSILGLGTIYALRPIEIDRLPGVEYLAKTGSPLHSSFMVVYPGRCIAGPIAINDITDHVDDFDGDGDKEILRFDVSAQTVTFVQFPGCPDDAP